MYGPSRNCCEDVSAGSGADLARPALSVVIAVYRSRDTVLPLYGRLVNVCAGLGCGSEIVFVNDASPDDVWSVLAELHRRDRSESYA